MSIIRRKRENNYAIIPNSIMEDDRLSFEARGLLAYILTRPDNWIFRTEHLKKVTGFGRDKCQRLIREILDLGYGKRETKHDENGHFQGQELVFYDDIFFDQPEPSNQALGYGEPDSPEPEITADGKSGPLISTDKKLPSKEIYISPFQKFWDAFADKRGREGAERVWNRKQLDNVADEVIAGAVRYTKTRGDNRQYWKQAQGWLNDGRWNDEPPSEQSGKTQTSLENLSPLEKLRLETMGAAS